MGSPARQVSARPAHYTRQAAGARRCRAASSASRRSPAHYGQSIRWKGPAAGHHSTLALSMTKFISTARQNAAAEKCWPPLPPTPRGRVTMQWPKAGTARVVAMYTKAFLSPPPPMVAVARHWPKPSFYHSLLQQGKLPPHDAMNSRRAGRGARFLIFSTMRAAADAMLIYD